MSKIGIFYGSTTGTTEHVAGMVAEALGASAADVHDVSKASPSDVGAYDVVILGSSTWGDGDMQDDMQDFIDGLKALDLKGKKMAFFGCGDESMTDTFCNAVGKMYESLKGTGAQIIGAYQADGYDFSHSDADVDGSFVGLLIDNVNHEDMTAARVNGWVDELKKEI